MFTHFKSQMQVVTYSSSPTLASLKHTESYDDFFNFRTLDWQAMMEGAEGNDLRCLMLLRMEVSAPLEMRQRKHSECSFDPPLLVSNLECPLTFNLLQYICLYSLGPRSISDNNIHRFTVLVR